MEVMPGYRKTEVGVIPATWASNVLSDVCDRIGVGLATSVTKYYRRLGVPIVRNLNIKDGFFDGADMLYISEDFAKASLSKAARALDVLTVRTGSNLGQTCVLPSSFDGCQTFTTLITTPKNRILDPEFLCLHMTSVVGRNEMNRLQVGGGKGNLNTGDLKRYRIAVPPLIEQRAISTALSDVDALLAKLDALIAKKRDLKVAAMQQLLTGQTRLPGFSGEWEVKRLGDVAGMGSGGTPTSSVAAYYDGDYPWVSISDMTKGGKVISKTDRNLSSIGLANSTAQMFSAGTILYAMYASLGECSIAGIPLCTSQAILGIRPQERLNGEFLYYYLTSLKNAVKSMGQQGTQANLNKGMVQAFQLSLPPVKEQAAIATVLSDMDVELTALEARRDKTRALKQGMMQVLLTGQIRLV